MNKIDETLQQNELANSLTKEELDGINNLGIYSRAKLIRSATKCYNASCSACRKINAANPKRAFENTDKYCDKCRPIYNDAARSVLHSTALRKRL